MSESSNPPTASKRLWVGKVFRATIALFILAVAGVITRFIFSTEPEPSRTAASRETAMLVDVQNVKEGTYRPELEVMGDVRPARDIILRPRVEGRVLTRSPAFVPGGFLEKGEPVLQIDAADYTNDLQRRRSELAHTKAQLEQARGRQKVAQQDYQLLDQQLPPGEQALALRKPQLMQARADVEAAAASVTQAVLELERTTVEAPFDAKVIQRDVNIGSQVSPGRELGRLVGVDRYWVEASVPLSDLQWMAFSNQTDQAGSKALLRDRSGWSSNVYRQGRVFKQVGTLEEQTRMARVLITVDDPLLRETSNTNLPRLIIGSFLNARIFGRPIKDVVRIKRKHLRKDDTVWVMKDGKLDIRDPEIVFRDARFAYIRRGVSNNERVVTTQLSTVTDGAKLRRSESGTSTTNDLGSTP